MNGISSAIKTRSTQLELAQIELQKRDSGKPQEEIRQSTVRIPWLE